MKARKIICTLGLVLCVLATCGDACWPIQTNPGGFPVNTQTNLLDSAGNLIASSPTPGEAVSGTWLSDVSGAGGNIYSFAGATNLFGTYNVNNGRVPANWSMQVNWEPPCGEQTFVSLLAPDLTSAGYTWECDIFVTAEGDNSSTHFVLPGQLPSTLTSYGNFSTIYGEPQLNVFAGGASGSLISTIKASSTVAGSSATFPFPTQSSGSALNEGFYGLVNTNLTSAGTPVWVDSSYLAVGGSTTSSGAFGVDATDVTETVTVCVIILDRPSCNSSGPLTIATPMLTQYYAGTVTFRGATITVGSEPVAVKMYGSSTKITTSGSVTTITTTPASAIVVNAGSNSVSIVSLVSDTDVANIAVGTQPMAVALNSADTYAYVPNYGSGTLSEVSLSTNTVSRTVSVAAGLQSVTMDPSGSYVWVGGDNALYKVSLSTFTVVSTVPVSGTVTSLDTSTAQNELVYTLVQNCCTASSSYAANELALSNLSTPGTYAKSSAAAYAAYTMEGTLPSAAALPQATNVVSSRFSNGMAASSTPTGFIVYDVISHQQIMTGTTPTPVRGIASDPDCKFAYFTLPDTNEYISVPLEYAP